MTNKRRENVYGKIKRMSDRSNGGEMDECRRVCSLSPADLDEQRPFRIRFLEICFNFNGVESIVVIISISSVALSK